MRTAPNGNSGTIMRRNFVHGLPEELEVHETARVVRVHHEQPLPTTKQHPMAHRATFAQILFQRHDPNITLREFGRELERRGGGAVRGAVVDDENLECALVFERRRCEMFNGRIEHDG